MLECNMCMVKDRICRRFYFFAFSVLTCHKFFFKSSSVAVRFFPFLSSCWRVCYFLDLRIITNSLSFFFFSFLSELSPVSTVHQDSKADLSQWCGDYKGLLKTMSCSAFTYCCFSLLFCCRWCCYCFRGRGFVSRRVSMGSTITRSDQIRLEHCSLSLSLSLSLCLLPFYLC